MKAKIIETGEVVEVHFLCKNQSGEYIYYEEPGAAEETCRTWSKDALVFFDEPIDWKQRRYELVKQMLPQAAAFAKEALLSGYSIENAEGKTVMQMVAEVSINYADAVIAKLKEK